MNQRHCFSWLTHQFLLNTCCTCSYQVNVQSLSSTLHYHFYNLEFTRCHAPPDRTLSASTLRIHVPLSPDLLHTNTTHTKLTPNNPSSHSLDLCAPYHVVITGMPFIHHKGFSSTPVLSSSTHLILSLVFFSFSLLIQYQMILVLSLSKGPFTSPSHSPPLRLPNLHYHLSQPTPLISKPCPTNP
jgi:hypothetical protein